jgi:hypothetical protein
MSLFYRMNTDLERRPIALDGLYAGPQASTCWLIGGGPSLAALDVAAIAASPAPKMAVNLGGTRLLRPTFWTAYDPTLRFHRSIYLDPGILKFVHRRRAMDLVPESTFKVCESPGVLHFDRDPGRPFARMLDPSAPGILDWADSLVQALDILYRLGFRRVLLAGCELRVAPSAAQLELARTRGVEPEPQETLAEFVKRCQVQGLSQQSLAQVDGPRQYHFEETKPLAAAIQTDQHYFRIVQALRLSRECLTRHGLELISVTPESRLNDYFPVQTVTEACDRIASAVGSPAMESTRGLYTQQVPRWSTALGPMRDVKPPLWAPATIPPSKTTVPAVQVEDEGWSPVERFAAAFVPPVEEG